jgi:hypothetical protein
VVSPTQRTGVIPKDLVRLTERLSNLVGSHPVPYLRELANGGGLPLTLARLVLAMKREHRVRLGALNSKLKATLEKISILQVCGLLPRLDVLGDEVRLRHVIKVASAALREHGVATKPISDALRELSRGTVVKSFAHQRDGTPALEAPEQAVRLTGPRGGGRPEPSKRGR